MTDAEVSPSFLPGGFLQYRDNDFAHSSRQDGAADDDGMPRRFAFENLADFLANAPNKPQVEAPIGLTRGADTNESQRGFPDGLCRVAGGAQPARSRGR